MQAGVRSSRGSPIRGASAKLAREHDAGLKAGAVSFWGRETLALARCDRRRREEVERVRVAGWLAMMTGNGDVEVEVEVEVEVDSGLLLDRRQGVGFSTRYQWPDRGQMRL